MLTVQKTLVNSYFHSGLNKNWKDGSKQWDLWCSKAKSQRYRWNILNVVLGDSDKDTDLGEENSD